MKNEQEEMGESTFPTINAYFKYVLIKTVKYQHRINKMSNEAK